MKEINKNNFIKIILNIPIIIGILLLLLLFFIFNDLYLNNKSLNNEWMYIMVFLIFFPIINQTVNNLIEKKFEEDGFNNLISDIIKNKLENSDLMLETITKINDEINGSSDKSIDNITKKILKFMYYNKADYFEWNDLLSEKSINNGKKFDRTNFYILYGETKWPINRRKKIFGIEKILVDKIGDKYKINQYGVDILDKELKNKNNFLK